MNSKRISTYGLLLALAFLFSYIESVIPVPIPIPGIKLGLANLVVLSGLYLMGVKEAFVLSIIRIILVGFTFGSPSTMMFGLAGGLLSWILMAVCRKTKILSITGVSVIGGISHNIGQILIAVWILNNTALIYYLPVLLLSGTVTGALIGILGSIMVSRLKKYEMN